MLSVHSANTNIQTYCVAVTVDSVCPLPCVCVSGSLFRGLLRRRLSDFFPPGLLTPPPDPIDPSDGACDLLLQHNEQNRKL